MQPEADTLKTVVLTSTDKGELSHTYSRTVRFLACTACTGRLRQQASWYERSDLAHTV